MNDWEKPELKNGWIEIDLEEIVSQNRESIKDITKYLSENTVKDIKIMIDKMEGKVGICLTTISEYKGE